MNTWEFLYVCDIGTQVFTSICTWRLMAPVKPSIKSRVLVSVLTLFVYLCKNAQWMHYTITYTLQCLPVCVEIDLRVYVRVCVVSSCVYANKRMNSNLLVWCLHAFTSEMWLSCFQILKSQSEHFYSDIFKSFVF